MELSLDEEREYRTGRIRYLLQCGMSHVVLRRAYDRFLKHRRRVRFRRRYNNVNRLRRMIETNCSLSELREIELTWYPVAETLGRIIEGRAVVSAAHRASRYVSWSASSSPAEESLLTRYVQTVGTVLHETLDHHLLVMEDRNDKWNISHIREGEEKWGPSFIHFRCTRDAMYCSTPLTERQQDQAPVHFTGYVDCTPVIRYQWCPVTYTFATQAHLHACFDVLPRVLVNMVYQYYEYISECYYEWEHDDSIRGWGVSWGETGLSWQDVENGVLCDSTPYPVFLRK